MQVDVSLECPSTGIYLVCFSLITLGLVFWEEDHRGECPFSSDIKWLYYRVAYPVDLNCHHLAQVEPVRFLHYSLSVPPPPPLQAVFFGRKSPYAVIHLGVGSYPPTHSEYLLVNS